MFRSITNVGRRVTARHLRIAGVAAIAASISVAASDTIGVAAAPAARTAPAAPNTTPSSRSFFDPFDRIDPRRWYVSDGWVNGGHQGCTWSRDNVQVVKGVLQLYHTTSANRLRRYKCAEIRTNGRYGYGTYEARIRTASGAGLNTALFTYSGPPLTPVHDEIDFEFLGKIPKSVQLNYYTAKQGGHESFADLGGDGSAAFNTYAIEWTPQSIKWFLNGRLIRTAGPGGLPGTPGQLFLSFWSGSDGVNDWLGKFDPKDRVITAEVDWIGFTAPGEKCLFRDSITCRMP